MKEKSEKLNYNYINERKYVCAKCGYEMEEYVPGIGIACRCKNCGYKDPCCE